MKFLATVLFLTLSYSSVARPIFENLISTDTKVFFQRSPASYKNKIIEKLNECATIFDSADELLLLQEMTNLTYLFYSEELTKTSLLKTIEQIRAKVLSNKTDLNEKEKKQIESIISMYQSGFLKQITADFFQDFLLAKVLNTNPSRKTTIGMRALEIDFLLSDIKHMLPIVKKAYSIVSKYNLSYAPDRGWNFSNFDFNNLKSDDNLLFSMSIFFPKEALHKLLDDHNKEAITLAKTVIIPGINKNQYRLMPESEYNSYLQKKFNIIDKHLRNFLIESKKDSGFFKNILSLAGINSKEYQQAKQEIDAANKELKELAKDLKLPNHIHKIIISAMNDMISKSSLYYTTLASNLNKSILASYLIMGGTVAAPVIGALGGSALGVGASIGASTGLKCALTYAAMPLELALIGAEVKAIYKWSQEGGDIICYLAKSFEEQTPNALIASGAFSYLPSLPFLAAGGAGLLTGVKGAEIAQTLTSISLSLGFTALMAHSAKTEYDEANILFKDADLALKNNDLLRSNQLNKQGWEKLTAAGIDAGFAIAGGLKIASHKMINPNHLEARVNYKELGNNLADYIIAPVSFGIDAISIRMMAGQSIWSALNASFVAHKWQLLGYSLFTVGTDYFREAYLTVEYDRFLRLTTPKMKQNPKKVLYINAISDDDKMATFPKYYFDTLYGKHPDATFIKVTSLFDFIDQLKALPQDNSFDRIEMVAHGSPGSFSIGDGNFSINIGSIMTLKNENINIASHDADLRLVSCSLGANLKNDPVGDKMLDAIGEALLPKGGHIYSSTKNIMGVPFNYYIARLLGLGVGLNMASLVAGYQNLKQIDLNQKSPINDKIIRPKDSNLYDSIKDIILGQDSTSRFWAIIEAKKLPDGNKLIFEAYKEATDKKTKIDLIMSTQDFKEVAFKIYEIAMTDADEHVRLAVIDQISIHIMYAKFSEAKPIAYFLKLGANDSSPLVRKTSEDVLQDWFNYIDLVKTDGR